MTFFILYLAIGISVAISSRENVYKTFVYKQSWYRYSLPHKYRARSRKDWFKYAELDEDTQRAKRVEILTKLIAACALFWPVFMAVVFFVSVAVGFMEVVGKLEDFLEKNGK